MDLNLDLEAALASLPACTRCRRRRIKCDSRLPSCRNCFQADKRCQFRDHVVGQDVPRQYLQSLIQHVHQLSEASASNVPGIAAELPSRDGLPRLDRSGVDNAQVCSIFAASQNPARLTDPGVSYYGPSNLYAYLVTHASSSADSLLGLQEGKEGIRTYQELFETITASYRPSSDAPTTNLPPQPLVQEILAYYQQSVEKFLPVIGSELLSQLHSLLLTGSETLQDDNSVEFAVLRLLLAISLQLMARYNPSLASIAMAYFLSISESRLREALSRPSVITLQLLTLISIYLMLDRQGGNIWTALNHAICLSETLELKPGGNEVLPLIRSTLFVLEVYANLFDAYCNQ